MRSPIRASTPSGSWVSGNGALRGLASPCETRGSSRISGGPSPTLRRRTMSALPTACAATSSTNTSAGRRDSPLRGAMLAQRGLRLILDFVPNHVAPDNPWVSDHPEYFIQGSADDAAQRSGVLHRVWREGVRLRPGPVLPGVAGCAPAQRLSPWAPAGGDRDDLGDCRTVRRHPVRHGDARAERHLRAHVGWRAPDPNPATTTGRR